MATFLRMCLNWKVVTGFAVIAVAVGVLTPGLLRNALPILLLAACPVSMLIMMLSMGGKHQAQVREPPADTDDADAWRARPPSLAAEQERAPSD